MKAALGPGAAALFGLAARQLGWRPADFWSATPAELLAALVPPGTEAPLGRAEFTRLMEREDGR